MSEQILNKAIELTVTIETKSNDLIETANKIAEHKDEIDAKEAALMQAIVAETNEAGKPKFSNDAARQAELMARGSKDEELAAKRKRYIDETSNKTRLTNEIEKYRLQVGLYKAFLTGGHA